MHPGAFASCRFSISRILSRGRVWRSVLALGAASGSEQAPAATRHIAITFDDLPGVSQRSTVANLDDINTRLLATLRIERVPAVGFVNERGVDVEGERDAAHRNSRSAGSTRTWSWATTPTRIQI